MYARSLAEGLQCSFSNLYDNPEKLSIVITTLTTGHASWELSSYLLYVHSFFTSCFVDNDLNTGLSLTYPLETGFSFIHTTHTGPRTHPLCLKSLEAILTFCECLDSITNKRCKIKMHKDLEEEGERGILLILHR